MSNLQIIDPTNYQEWDNLILTNPRSSIFHTAGWATLLSKSYNFKPYYFTVIKDTKLKALIPLMEVKNLFYSGKKGVSLPFTDFCCPMVDSKYEFQNIFDSIICFGKKKGWKTIELRGGQEFLSGIIHSESFYTHSLLLNSNCEDIFSSFRSSTRRNIRKAEKHEIVVKTLDTPEALRIFYDLHCRTRQNHGLPPQPFYFFKQLYKQIILKKMGCVTLASKNDDRPIAGAIFLSFANNIFYKYGASDKKYNLLRPNNLIMWQAIKTYAENGAQCFNFGRTDLDHNGLRQFKNGWGVNESIIKYYKYDLTKDCFLGSSQGYRTSYSVFNKMPLPLLKIIGKIVYRYVG